jgi:hypothetical protein
MVAAAIPKGLAGKNNCLAKAILCIDIPRNRIWFGNGSILVGVSVVYVILWR